MYIVSEQTPPVKSPAPDSIPSILDRRSPISDDDLIIFPTVLLSHKYKQTLIQGNTPHNPDQITTLSDFCRKYHDEHGKNSRIISDGQALVILTKTLERIKEDIPFFFNQGNPTSRTMKDLYALRSIISQRSINFPSHPLINSSEKCRQISLALTAYQETLTDNQLLDSSALIEWTINHITSRTGVIFASVRIHRLFEIFPREKSLILAIRDHAKSFRYEYLSGKDREIFSLPDWLKPEELERIEPAPEFLQRSDLFTSVPDQTPDDLVQTRVFASPVEELESIAEEIHNLVENGISLEDIVITFPKISSVLSSLQEVLDDFGIPSHSFVGEPLIREPVISYLLLFPSLVTDAYPRESINHLISSPYFNIRQAGLHPITVGDFDRIVRTAGIEGGYSWDEPLQALKNLPEDAVQSVPRISDESIDAVLSWITEIQKDCNQFMGNLTPAGYVAVFQRLCKKWMQPEFGFPHRESDDPILISEGQAYNQFLGCLTRLSSLLDSRETVDIFQFRRFLIYLLEEPVNLTPDLGGVRIMGLRQVEGMQYSSLFLGGLVEGEIPNPSTRIPLLTSQESEQLGSRGLHEAIRSEEYYFISALAAGKKVHLSASKTRGERKILTSSFFEQVKKEKKSQKWGREIVHSLRRASIRAGITIAKQRGTGGYCPDDLLTWLPENQIYGSVATRILIEEWYRTGTPDTVYDGILTEHDDIIAWLSGSDMFGSERIWSPTQLETYANCPFRFFLDRVVRVTPLPEVDPTLSPARKGTLIHDTLCDFYSTWCAKGPRQVSNLDFNEASEQLRRIGTETSAQYKYQSPVWHATVASLLGFDGVPGIYERFLIHESRKETFLRPEMFEFEIGTSQSGPDDKKGYVLLECDEGEPVRIQGRIDRVDTTPDGRFAIIDYKTGSNYPNGVRIKEGKALQLPLYLLALEKMHEEDDLPKIGIGGSYLEINRTIKQAWPLLDPAEKQEAGVSSRAKGTPDFRDVTRGALIAAQRYITAIRSGVFPVTRDTCTISKYCPYSGICRLDRFRIIEPADEEGGE